MVERKIKATAHDIRKVEATDDGDVWSFEFYYDGDFIENCIVTTYKHHTSLEEVHDKITASLKLRAKRHEVKVLGRISVTR